MSSAFNGVKVFCATMAAQRQALGEQVTAWLEDAKHMRPGFEIVNIQVAQSSDEAFHCISVVLFFREYLPKASTTKERSRNDQKVPASTDISSRAKTPAEVSPPSASTNEPKKRR